MFNDFSEFQQDVFQRALWAKWRAHIQQPSDTQLSKCPQRKGLHWTCPSKWKAAKQMCPIRTRGQTPGQGQRQRASPDAQPQLCSEHAQKYIASSAWGCQNDQDRNSAVCPQLHLGPDCDSTYRATGTQCRLPACPQPGLSTWSRCSLGTFWSKVLCLTNLLSQHTLDRAQVLVAIQFWCLHLYDHFHS